jgi:hypothetical protein
VISQFRIVPIAAAIGMLCATAARAERVTQAQYLAVVNDMVSELAPASARAAVAIRDTYRPYTELLALDDFGRIEDGLATGGLVPLPLDVPHFNVRVRLEGAGAIGERDVLHQASYVSARPAAIGCLLDVASRVKSGPVEVTSLARHMGYQQDLRVVNPNATTDVPTHALGLAFDIAMVNTPLETVLEIRDVLREMSDAGDILVIAEHQQLVFHVLPQPSRLGWYADVYAHAINGEPWGRPVDIDGSLTPMVSAAIASLQPMPAMAAEWWAADNVPVDASIAVRVDAPDIMAVADPQPRRTTSYVALLGELMSSTWRMMSLSNRL